jgi:hypothetical protein
MRLIAKARAEETHPRQVCLLIIVLLVSAECLYLDLSQISVYCSVLPIIRRSFYIFPISFLRIYNFSLDIISGLRFYFIFLSRGPGANTSIVLNFYTLCSWLRVVIHSWVRLSLFSYLGRSPDYITTSTSCSLDSWEKTWRMIPRAISISYTRPKEYHKPTPYLQDSGYYYLSTLDKGYRTWY